jgi:hypothetical protein
MIVYMGLIARYLSALCIMVVSFFTDHFLRFSSVENSPQKIFLSMYNTTFIEILS